MKTSIALITLFASLSSFASGLVCNEKYDIRQEVLKARYSIKITELQDITRQHPEGKNFDDIHKVRVEIQERMGSRVNSQILEAISFKADVQYWVKASNLHFSTYLDELDETSLTFVQVGRKVTVRMSCRPF